MVNSSDMFSTHLPNRSTAAYQRANRQTEQNNLQQQNQQLQQTGHQPLHFMEMNTSDTPFGGTFCQEEQGLTKMQQSPYSYPEEAKPSPSYMDSDVQFNYPSTPISCVKVEHPGFEEPAQFPEVPTIQRQASVLNDLMEVIDDHDINDTTSTLPTTPLQKQPCHPNNAFRSKPIDIQRQPPANNMSLHRKIILHGTPSSETSPGQNFAVTVPPASDTRQYNQFGVSPANSSFTSSPAGLPFTRYQQKDFSSPQSCAYPFEPAYLNFTPASFQNSDSVRDVFQQTQDILSPAPSIVSPQRWQSTPQSSGLASGSNFGGDDVFVFDDVDVQQFKPSQSCPNFNFSRNERSYSGDFCGQNSMLPPYPPKSHSNFSSVSSLIAAEGYGLNSPCTKLEEVDPATFANLKLEKSLPEEDRLAAKRMRNNRACQASRERRKMKKAEKEATKERLQAENLALKQKIAMLENAVSSAHEDVRRRMSQSVDSP